MSEKYAESTQVPIERSKAEIERTLARFGADEFAYMVKKDSAVILFVTRGKRVKFVLPIPPPEEFSTTPTGKARAAGAMSQAFEQECRRRWRALALVIKAKLEAVDSGIVTFEEEFLSHFVLPSGETFADRFVPALDEIYASGRVRALIE